MPEALIAAPPDHDHWTLREIRQQPATLRATQALLIEQRMAIERFVAPLLARSEVRIVLTGAGTSAFIGESLSPWLTRLLDRPVEAVATTDIVSAPRLFLRDVPTLLVSFGRSGSSPESIAAVDIADAALREVHHLFVTCNPDGDLARRRGANVHAVILPEETHDRGFAMTSSFTAMMLAALSVLGGIEATAARVPALASATAAALELAAPLAEQLARRRFERVVYLGSGVFKGLAREAALKLLELSDGQVVTAFDTTMGFRHGPKTVVNDRTLLVLFLSNDPLTRRYDLDVLEELRRDATCGALLAISAQPVDGDAVVVPGMTRAEDVDLLFPFIAPAQLFALRVSEALGLTPDQPNRSGIVNRVVQGVRIHSVAA